MNARAEKIHISLPPDLFAFVARRRDERQQSMSAAIAESIRRDMLAERQARLDEALSLDAEANVAIARASGAAVSRVIARE